MPRGHWWDQTRHTNIDHKGDGRGKYGNRRGFHSQRLDRLSFKIDGNLRNIFSIRVGLLAHTTFLNYNLYRICFLKSHNRTYNQGSHINLLAKVLI